MRNIIETGNIISACIVSDADGYEHPKHRDNKPDRARYTSDKFKLRELCSVTLISNLGTKAGKQLLSWVLKHT